MRVLVEGGVDVFDASRSSSTPTRRWSWPTNARPPPTRRSGSTCPAGRSPVRRSRRSGARSSMQTRSSSASTARRRARDVAVHGRVARVATCLASCHPNAGLPNAFGGYDETPEVTSTLLGEFADGRVQHRRELLRLHAQHARDRRGGRARRAAPHRRAAAPPAPAAALRAVRDRAGHPLRADWRAQRDRLGALPPAGRGRRLHRRRRRCAGAGARRREHPRREHGRRPVESEQAMRTFLNVSPRSPRSRGCRSWSTAKRSVLGSPAVHPGQGHRQLDQHEGEAEFLEHARASATARPPWSWRSTRRARPPTSSVASPRPRLRPAHRHRVPRPNMIFDLKRLAVATGIEEHELYAEELPSRRCR